MVKRSGEDFPNLATTIRKSMDGRLPSIDDPDSSVKMEGNLAVGGQHRAIARYNKLSEETTFVLTNE